MNGGFVAEVSGATPMANCLHSPLFLAFSQTFLRPLVCYTAVLSVVMQCSSRCVTTLKTAV